ncbi:MAG: nucleotidyl transferase AbiEii/AbiGii toxin family protein [Candidatus Sericytochromatia bacterium]
MNNRNTEMIELISSGLGNELIEKVIFVGGSVVGFYSTNKLDLDIRYTEDVDCVVNISIRNEFNNFEQELRKRNFKNDIRENAPICRWNYLHLTVDIMPVDFKIFGFTNEWYRIGLENVIDFKINEKLSIQIFSAPYFLATKIQANNNRGGTDIRFSHDFEDIVFILNNRIELLEEIINLKNKKLKKYLKTEFNKLLSLSYIDEAIECVIPYGLGNKTINKIKDIMKNISEI